MRKLLLVVLLLVAGVIALGVHQGWFHFSKSGDQGSGTVNVGVSIDQERIKEDAAKAQEKAKAVGAQARERVAGTKPQGTTPPEGGPPK